MDERIDNTTGGSRRRVAGLLAAVIAGGSLVPSGSSDEASAGMVGPRLIAGDVADALVRVRGGAACSGTPIAGTRYVVTAAHCVLDLDGRPGHRTVVRDDATYVVDAVWVDTRYVDDPSPRYDAAILEVDGPLPGPSAAIGTSVPTSGALTIAGFQPIDTDGTLLRGENPNDRPLPDGATSGVVQIESRPAGCTVDVDDVEVTIDRLDMVCGLIPSASGGGVYVDDGDEVALVGIISTVAYDLTGNGVVPLASLHDLLDHPDQYRYPADGLGSATAVQVIRT